MCLIDKVVSYDSKGHRHEGYYTTHRCTDVLEGRSCRNPVVRDREEYHVHSDHASHTQPADQPSDNTAQTMAQPKRRLSLRAPADAPARASNKLFSSLLGSGSSGKAKSSRRASVSVPSAQDEQREFTPPSSRGGRPESRQSDDPPYSSAQSRSTGRATVPTPPTSYSGLPPLLGSPGAELTPRLPPHKRHDKKPLLHQTPRTPPDTSSSAEPTPGSLPKTRTVRFQDDDGPGSDRPPISSESSRDSGGLPLSDPRQRTYEARRPSRSTTSTDQSGNQRSLMKTDVLDLRNQLELLRKKVEQRDQREQRRQQRADVRQSSMLVEVDHLQAVLYDVEEDLRDSLEENQNLRRLLSIRDSMRDIRRQYEEDGSEPSSPTLSRSAHHRRQSSDTIPQLRHRNDRIRSERHRQDDGSIRVTETSRGALPIRTKTSTRSDKEGRKDDKYRKEAKAPEVPRRERTMDESVAESSRTASERERSRAQRAESGGISLGFRPSLSRRDETSEISTDIEDDSGQESAVLSDAERQNKDKHRRRKHHSSHRRRE